LDRIKKNICHPKLNQTANKFIFGSSEFLPQNWTKPQINLFLNRVSFCLKTDPNRTVNTLVKLLHIHTFCFLKKENPNYRYQISKHTYKNKHEKYGKKMKLINSQNDLRGSLLSKYFHLEPIDFFVVVHDSKINKARKLFTRMGHFNF
jgi:hypothetical protein